MLTIILILALAVGVLALAALVPAAAVSAPAVPRLYPAQTARLIAVLAAAFVLVVGLLVVARVLH